MSNLLLCTAFMISLSGCAHTKKTTADPDKELRGWLRTCERADPAGDESDLRKAILDCHQAARALKHDIERRDEASEIYASADLLYAVWIASYAETEYAYEMRYAYGEFLYEMKRYGDAWVQYNAVIDLDPEGSRSKFCAESAIFAAEEMVKSEGAAPRERSSVTPVPLGDWEVNQLASLTRYTELYPDDAKTLPMLYKAAYLLYEHNLFVEASEHFNTVIALDPGSRTAIQAANLILDAFVLVEDWVALRDAALAFYEQDGLGNEHFKEELYLIHTRASEKVAQEASPQSQEPAEQEKEALDP